MKDLLVTISFLLCIAFLGCDAQQRFSYQQLPASYVSNMQLASLEKEVDAIAAKAFDLTTVLPRGYSKEGKIDYTAQLQEGINRHTNVVFPDFPVMINDNGLTLKSNSFVVFRTHSALILKPTAKRNFFMMAIHDVENVKVYCPVLIGDRKNHLDAGGEWGMGISIRGAANITVFHPVISSCWGDGIYIGQSPTTKKIPFNITINNAVLDNNRRNGISVIAVNGLKLIHPVVSNTNGTPPMSGIDVEPNDSSALVDNILMDHPVTFNNGKYGIVIGLDRLPSTSARGVNISINNHLDDGSATAFWLGGSKDVYKKGTLPLRGSIQVTDPVWKNNATPFKGYKTYDFAPVSKFTNITVEKKGSRNEVQKIKLQHGNKKNLEID
ncbi:right-handed parallel beta-helix repeat-containing protein [Chitinophaga sp. OAE865]|uniref:right-handed parallel beta-helix repeat-containing protein n=1 Tax=Chitinophaga sp. OAE865 TaxID=2817898 RepID=UPI001AE86063